MRHFSVCLLASLCISIGCPYLVQAQQPWSGILSPNRAVDWRAAGLPATLPDGEVTPNPWTPPTRVQCGSTIAAGASTATINSALAACGSGHYVLLGPGNFTINSGEYISLYAQNGVTLRGSGAAATKVTVAATSIGGAVFRFGIANQTWACPWTSGYSAGSTSLTMTSAGCEGNWSGTSGALGSPPVVGQVMILNQCDSGYSGFPICTGTPSDNGGLYVCGDNNACQTGNTGTPYATSAYRHQMQGVRVTSIVNGGGTYTIGFTPAIKMPNWNSSNTPVVRWDNNPSNTATAYGNGLEDMTIVAQTGSSSLNYTAQLDGYGSWVKGVRFIGAAPNNGALMVSGMNTLASNNYFFTNPQLDGSYPVPLQLGASNALVLNNIFGGGGLSDGVGGNTGTVLAYNYERDAFTAYYENSWFDHNAYSSFNLLEGNQYGSYMEDNTWGTHGLDTWFRNYASGWDPPYLTINARAMFIDNYQRFMNIVGNSLGPGPSNAPFSVYQATSYPTPAYVISNTDALASSSLLRWGNCDTVTGTCRFQSSEVPVVLAGNAAPFANTVPSSSTLPASFFMSTTAHPSGGTGLNWWKVCKSWISFPSTCAAYTTQPFPAVGPDVTGGPYVNGTAYDVPAAIAWKSLPIDPTYQNSYTIASSSWSGGTETLTFAGGVLPNTTHLMGGFMVSGSPCAGGEFLITGSTSTTVSYALGANPGSCAGGIMKFPDVRQFDEAVYQLDSASSSTVQPAPPIVVSGTVK
jgi:hypothetical protein